MAGARPKSVCVLVNDLASTAAADSVAGPDEAGRLTPVRLPDYARLRRSRAERGSGLRRC